MFVQVGGDEAMLSEVRYMVCTAQSHGVDARIEEWRGLVHAFQGFSVILPEAVDALRSVRAFVDELSPPRASTERIEKTTRRRITDL